MNLKKLYWYDHLEKHSGWKSIGKVLCDDLMEGGDIIEKTALQNTYKLEKSVW